jgi:hypothetical protein
MPTLNIDHNNADDIIESMKLLEKLLPDQTMFLLNTKDEEAVVNLIAHLRTFLPQSAIFKVPAEIPAEWAPYDEPITKEMLIELVNSYPKRTKTLVRDITKKGHSDRYERLTERIQEYHEGVIPFSRNLYKGHVFHSLMLKNRPLIGNSENEFWQYALNTWNLPPTPEDWLPPDMR